MPKVSLRERLLKQRQALSTRECSRLSQHVQGRLSETIEFKQAACIALYSPIRNEVDTHTLFMAARGAGKRVCYPRMQDEHLEFLQIEAVEELAPGCMGVLEPVQGPRVELHEIALMVVPGVGFDEHGHRLGYGRGYYDRVLEDGERRPLLCGLAFEQQVVERLPRDPHDVQLDVLVTENTIRRFGSETRTTHLSQKGRA